MRKVNRAKRRKFGVWGCVAVLGTAIFGVPTGGNDASANANDGAASRAEAAAREDGANGGFWPRLGSDAFSTSEFSGNSGLIGVLENVGENDKTPTDGTAAQGRVESANFIGYSARSDFNEQENSVSGRARLVDWTAPDAPSGNANRSLEPSSGVPTALGEVGGNIENGEIAKIDKRGENSEYNGAGEEGTIAPRPKTPILRDEPVATAQSGGSLASALVSTFGALAVVLGAFFASVALLRRTGANGGGGSALEIVDSLAVGDKARLLTIRWGNRLILAAKTPEKIASLAEIADADEASALLAEIERRKENASLGKVGEKTAAIWKRGRDAASVWRTAFGTKGRRR